MAKKRDRSKKAAAKKAAPKKAPPKKKAAPRRKAAAKKAPERSPLPFRCAGCGEEHDLAQLSFGTDAPAQWHVLTEAERARSVLGAEQCVIEADGETARFVRAVLVMPLYGEPHDFEWGVWVSLPEASFDELHRLRDDPDRAAFGPYHGRLSTPVPGYPDSLFLEAQLVQRPPGLRPLVTLLPSGHPLAVHQRDGIHREDLLKIVVPMLHPPR